MSFDLLENSFSQYGEKIQVNFDISITEVPVTVPVLAGGFYATFQQTFLFDSAFENDLSDWVLR